jgi:predicted kinase
MSPDRMTSTLPTPRLLIVCGLPGSGKTTLAKKLERTLGAIRLCPDEWMQQLAIDLWDEPRRANVEALQWTLAQQLLQRRQSVVIEWGTWGRSERDTLRLGARALNAAVELHYLSAPVEVLFERLQQRGTETPPITFEQLQQWADMINVPTPEEMALYDAPSIPEPADSADHLPPSPIGRGPG